VTLIKRGGTITGSFGCVCRRWLQYWLVSDDHMRIVEFEPAAFGGWRFVRVTDQGHDEGCGWSEASIVAFQDEYHDAFTIPCEQDPALIDRLLKLTQAEIDARVA
jgi:hypothetical protein